MSEPADLRVLDPAAADREAWIAAGQALARDRSEASWEFADWLAAGHEAWGKEAMEEAAGATGDTLGKFRNYLRTARAYPPNRRRFTLTFSHHLEAAALPEAEADRVLDQAEAEGWSRNETRAAAREISLEGKVARQAARIRELERALKAARTDPRDAAAQAGSRLGATQRLVKDEVNRAASMIEELAQPEILDGLHGNARHGLVKKITASCKAIVADVNAANARIAAAAAKIKGAPL